MKYIPFIGAALALSASASAQEKPNVVFILVDDMQAQAIHALGGDQVVTPNIDSIVGRGTTFTNAHINGGITGALSMPSRAMLMTGRGLFEIESDGLRIPETHTTLPEHLKNNGYTTFATGKWHSDIESFARSFTAGESIFFGGMHRYELNGHRSPRLNHFDPAGKYGAETRFIGEGFSSEIYADAAIDFISDMSDGSAPFFAYVAFTSPHDPRNNMPDYGYKYPHEIIDLPPNYLPEHPFNNGDMDVRDELILSVPRTKDEVRRELAFYYGMVSEVDLQIGRIMRTIEDKGLSDNTIVVFASDNGLAVGRHGLLGKQNLYEHSMAVPLVFAGCGMPHGVMTPDYCYLYDVYPTLCDALGVSKPSSVTGVSLLPVLKGGDGGREELLLAYSSIQRSIIKDGWKLIMYNVDGKITKQLFNLREDPLEMNNLAGEREYAKKLAQYEKLLGREMKKKGDFCDLSRPGWWSGQGRIGWEESIKLYTFGK